MGRVIVEDEMEIQALGCLAIDDAEKAKEFLMSVARQALADHFAIQGVQGGE